MTHAKPKILIVDDERPIASLLAAAFEYKGYSTARAYSGEEAVQVARVFCPDLILSDVVMGRMNGFEAAIQILGTQPRCKVLFLSGSAEYSRSLAEAHGAEFEFNVLIKPVPLPDILARVAAALSSGAQVQCTAA